LCILLLSGLVYSQSSNVAPTKEQVSQAARILGVSEIDLQRWVDSRFITVPRGIPDITAVQLYQEYESQAMADRKYKDKEIKVTGQVYTIEELYDHNLEKRYALRFKTGTYSWNVCVFFDNADIEPIFNISTNQTVSIIGTLIEKRTSGHIFIDHAKITR